MEKRIVNHSDVMPPGFPYYMTTREPTVYRDVIFQVLFFKIDDKAMTTLLPSPLEPALDRLCVVVAIDVPYASNYGPFQETFLQVPCTFYDNSSFYIPYVFVNNVRAICAGREIWGTPKIFADVIVQRRNMRITSRTVFEGHKLIEVMTTTGQLVEPIALPTMSPAYRLKLIPSADGLGPAVKQLVTSEPLDSQLSDLTRGEGQVTFGASNGLDLTGLHPHQTFDAFTFKMSYRETFGSIAFDYLSTRLNQKLSMGK